MAVFCVVGLDDDGVPHGGLRGKVTVMLHWLEVDVLEWTIVRGLAESLFGARSS